MVTVSQMEQVTQQNAVLVEEMAAAANSLQSQAAALVRMVAVLQIGREAELPSQELIALN